MTLINCRECGKEISDTSKRCIHCGAKIKKEKIKKEKNKEVSKNKKKLILIILGIILIIGTIITIYFLLNNNVEQTNLRDDTKSQVEIITDYINIRENPNVSSDVLGKVYQGEIYTILSENNDSEYKWIEIETSNGIRGYISGVEDYVKRLYLEKDVIEEESTIDNPVIGDEPNNENTDINDNRNNNQKPNTNNNQKPNNNNNSNTNTNKPNNDNNSNNNPNIDNNNPIPPNENDNKEQEELNKQYLKEVDAENLRYENEVKSIKEEYDLHELNAKDKMADALYFVSFFGGLYYGTERDYRNEYQKLMNNGKYDEADILVGKWHHTQEYRKWEEYLRGLSQEEQYYLEQKQKEHNNILNELKVKYNQ